MSVSEGAAPSRRILVVSGDPAVVREARAGFPADFDVVAAADARSAISLMSTGSTPALAILDLQTGSAGGFALARDLSQRPRLAGIPILMLIDRDQDRWLARQAGARAVLTKPLDADQLVAAGLSLLS